MFAFVETIYYLLIKLMIKKQNSKIIIPHYLTVLKPSSGWQLVSHQCMSDIDAGVNIQLLNLTAAKVKQTDYKFYFSL